MEQTKSEYKIKLCDVCKRSYKINYYYDHKKSAKHVKNMNSVKIKDDLLKDDIDIIASTDINTMLQNIIDQVHELKNMINKMETN